MASSQDSKLIFAPSGSKTNTQADQFTKGTLSLQDLDRSSPIPQFHMWFSQAQQPTSQVSHPETCVLSTANLPSGRVSSRVVYLKELESSSSSAQQQQQQSDESGQRGGGFVIYSNFGTSRKAQDLATNPWASLNFHWEALQRQVRVEGKTVRLTREESQKYFDTRARGSRIGAWASKQSQTLHPDKAAGGADEIEAADDGRKELEGWVKETESQFEGQEDIPVPEFWGGLRIIPQSVEFWQGRDSRLHDRFVYTWVEEDEKWDIQRLSP